MGLAPVSHAAFRFILDFRYSGFRPTVLYGTANRPSFRKIQMKIHTLLLASIAALPATALADWSSFRNGGSSVADSKLPTKWTPDEGIAWQHELPGYGQSTPIVVGDHVYVTAVIGPMKDTCAVLCMSLADGSEVWRQEFPASAKAASNYAASRAAPTPVADEDGVYAFFESGDIIAVSATGDELWKRNLSEELGKFENNHGLGSSPAQNATHVFINLEHKGPSCLVAINKASGKIDWKADRPSGSSWSSPVVVDYANHSLVLVSSAGSVSAYDAATGKQFWQIDDLEGNTVPSPTPLGNHVYVGARLPEFAKEGSVRSNCCIQLSAEAAEQPEVTWRAERAISDYASPVAIDRFVYFINKVGVLTCIDGPTGKTHYRKRLSGECWATPMAAGDHLYCFAKNGSSQVIAAGEEYKLVATNQLWDPKSPPKPETYVETARGGHGHGAHGAQAGGPPQHGAGHGEAKHGAGKNTAQSHGAGQHSAGAAHPHAAGGKPAEASGSSERRPGGGMIAAMMRGDKDGDGILSADEIPVDFKRMLPRVDTNGDGALDADELKAMAESFAKRRAGSQASARDPIVYGAVASGGSIVVRTGTRLYCIR